MLPKDVSLDNRKLVLDLAPPFNPKDYYLSHKIDLSHPEIVHVNIQDKMPYGHMAQKAASDNMSGPPSSKLHSP